MILFNSRQNPFLSNFYVHPFTIQFMDGNVYTFNCAEAAYQCAKMPDRSPGNVQPWLCLNGYQSKNLGKRIPLRADWSDVKLYVMEKVTQAKFDEPELRRQLMATGREELVHLSPWDTFWGVDTNLEGNNWLGGIIMGVRAGRSVL